MNKFYLSFFFSLISIAAFAAKPTIPSSQIYTTGKTCGSINIQWTNGNGNARIVIVREDTAVNYTPIDSTSYPCSISFKNSPNLGGNNYAVLETTGNTCSLINLRPGHKYYFSIFEFNDPNNPLFLSNNPATFVDSTFDIKYDFSTLVLDSCENSNRIRFTNTTKSGILNLKYRFTFSDNSTIDSNFAEKHFNSFGTKTTKIEALNAPSGCPASFSKTNRIYPKKVLNFDFSKLKNDTQMYDGNYFEIKTSPLMAPFPMSFTYDWDFGNNVHTFFPQMRYSYQDEGTYNVKLITHIKVNNQYTGCRDTQGFRLVVLHNPFLYTSITPIIDTLANNLFTYSNIDSSVTSQIWYFGDGDSSLNASAQHSYSYADTFPVRLYVETDFGYKGFKDFQVYVLDSGFNFTLFKIKTISNKLQNNLVVFSHIEKLCSKQIWYFGDGDSSTLDSCSHTYKNAGWFDGRLVCTLLDGSVYTKNFLIKIIDPNSIEENKAVSFEFMPNPAHKILYIYSHEMENDAQITISNALGQNILDIELKDASQGIDVSTLMPGMYLLSYKTKVGITEVKRLMIQ